MIYVLIIFVLLAGSGWILFLLTRREFVKAMIAGEREFDRLAQIALTKEREAKEYKIWAWIFWGFTLLLLCESIYVAWKARKTKA